VLETKLKQEFIASYRIWYFVWTKGVWYLLHCIALIWWYNWSTSAYHNGNQWIM